jgi:hypothetical protein
MHAYFKRLAVLIGQIPYGLRRLLLPEYMLYTGFKGASYLDSSDRLGFEIKRERASRISIKQKNTLDRVEDEIFGALGKENMLIINGRHTSMTRLNLTCKEFSDAFSHKLPKGLTVLSFDKTGDVGPIEVGADAEAKIIDCGIYWSVKGNPFVKHVPFAWLFGNKDLLSDMDPIAIADSDFYSSLFGKLQYILTRGYEVWDSNIRTRLREFYDEMLDRVEGELKRSFSISKGDEQTFQSTLEKYRFFLYPAATCIESQVQINGYKADFRVTVGQSTYIYVEIEPPYCKPFNGRNASGRLRAALQQVNDWRNVLVHNNGCSDKRVKFMVLIGLLEDLDEDEKRSLNQFDASEEQVTVCTYDYIINVRTLRRLSKEA